jgi:hypothetical protein
MRLERNLPRSEKSKRNQKKFIEAARELGCDEDESAFDEIVKKVAKVPPPRKEDENKKLKRRRRRL